MKQLSLFSLIGMSTLLFSSSAFTHGLSKEGGVYDWTGIYAGLNAGAVKHTMHITDNQATTFNATIQQVADAGFIGGFQIGYRRQLTPAQSSGVYGLELSSNFASARFQQNYGSPYALYQLSSTNKLKNFGLLQLMGGIAADRSLLFLAAGLAWTEITGSTSNVAGIPFYESFSENKNALGAGLSAGIEYAFSEKISARVKVDALISSAYSVYNETGSYFQISNDVAQGTLGVNYKFG